MGCHTWFYQKVNRTQEAAIELYLQGIEEDINTWRDTTSIKELNIDGIDDNFISFYLSVLERRKRIVSKGLCKRAVWNHYQSDKLFEYIDGKGLYIDNNITHDIIRVRDYPEIKFFSFEEMLKWIESQRNAEKANTAHITQQEIHTLKEYWNNYPDSMVCFG